MKELSVVYELLKDTRGWLAKYRLWALLENFKGLPYSSQDNLTSYSLLHFDCQTLVEVVLALMLTKDLSSFEAFKANFENELMNLRYHSSSQSLLTRNHFVSLDFLPNQRENLHDISQQIYTCHLSRTIIDKAAWFKKMHNIPGLLTAPITVTLPYINLLDVLDHYIELINYFPTFSLLNIVRPSWDLKTKIGTDLDTSHLGLVIKHANQLFFWHATSINKMVVYEPLNAYITKQLSIPSIRGINIHSIEGIS